MTSYFVQEDKLRKKEIDTEIKLQQIKEAKIDDPDKILEELWKKN